MKRLSIITNPTAVNDLADIDADFYENGWQLKVERLHTKQLRKFRHQLA
jgi:hypothetical protein